MSVNKKAEVIELLEELSGYIDHGECFYDKGMFNDLLVEIDLFIDACRDLFESNKEDD